MLEGVLPTGMVEVVTAVACVECEAMVTVTMLLLDTWDWVMDPGTHKVKEKEIECVLSRKSVGFWG